jgi:hypothetical protein
VSGRGSGNIWLGGRGRVRDNGDDIVIAVGDDLVNVDHNVSSKPDIPRPEVLDNAPSILDISSKIEVTVKIVKERSETAQHRSRLINTGRRINP